MNKLVVFGKRHLDFVVSEFVTYYNTERLHMERESLPPIREVPKEIWTISLDRVEVKEHLGGLA